VYVGGTGRLADVMQRISPSLVDWYLRGPGDAIAGQRTDRADDGTDNLFTPSTGSGSATGRFGQYSKSTSAYTKLFGLNPTAGRAAAAAGLAVAIMVIRRAGGRR
jgi:hypothetical protein